MAKKKIEKEAPARCARVILRRSYCALNAWHEGDCDDGSAGKAKGVAEFIERENARNRRRALETAKALRAAADDIERAANGAISMAMVPSSLRNISFPVADAVEALTQLEIRAQTASFFSEEK